MSSLFGRRCILFASSVPITSPLFGLGENTRLPAPQRAPARLLWQTPRRARARITVRSYIFLDGITVITVRGPNIRGIVQLNTIEMLWASLVPVQVSPIVVGLWRMFAKVYVNERVESGTILDIALPPRLPRVAEGPLLALASFPLDRKS